MDATSRGITSSQRRGPDDEQPGREAVGNPKQGTATIDPEQITATMPLAPAPPASNATRRFADLDETRYWRPHHGSVTTG